MIEIVDQGARIRGAAFWSPDDGCIVAGDLEGDDQNMSQTLVFEVADNAVARYQLLDWIAHAACPIPHAAAALVVEDRGRLLVVRPGSMDEEQVQFADRPTPAIVLRGLRVIQEEIFAVGMSGLVLRRRGDALWDCLAPPTRGKPGLEAIDGFSLDEIYAVGWKGALLELQPSAMIPQTAPTSVILTDVACAGDGQVYACGQNGVLLRGRHKRWAVICEGATDENLWSVAWFKNRLYVATILSLYTVEDDALVPVRFGEDPPTSCYRLTIAHGYLWSVGREDILRFDGENWLRIA